MPFTDAAAAALRGGLRRAVPLAVVTMLGATTAWADDYLYTVRPGDNPWTVTERYLRDLGYWPRLLQYNQIEDARLIQPGSTLRIPKQWLAMRAAGMRVGQKQGSVEVRAANETGDTWRPAQTGRSLSAGQCLRTGADGSAMLELGGGTVVLVRPDTELRLVRASESRVPDGGQQLRIELLRGGLENVVQRRPGGGTRFEIQTPAAVAAVRGTEFRVSTSAGAARAEVLEGAVAFTGRRGSVTLPAGTGSVATPDRPSRAAVPLLPAPDLAQVPDRIRRLPISIPLQPLSGAARYQTQLQPVGSALIASDEGSPTPHARARDVPDGDYMLRVRGVDENGLEGFQAMRPLTVDARPEPPVLSAPASDATLAAAGLTFRWTDAGVADYRLQVSDSAQFASPQVDRAVAGTTAELDAAALPPGQYFWRVASRIADGKQGPYSDVERLRVIPAAPQVDPPAQDGKSLNLRWRAASAGARYRFQLARDEQFADVVVERRVDEPAVTLEDLEPGGYLLRVQTVTADGFEGAWSSPQRIEIEAPRVVWPLLLIPLIPLMLVL
ncbi:MAG: FecR domain-containing protein [Burkholderiaceae bacterium]